MKSSPSSQRGFTLVVGLILLILMTLVSITTFRLSDSSMLVVGNMQWRDQAQAGAQEALDDVISGTLFTTSPAAVFSNTNCPSGLTLGNGLCVDLNGDGKNLVTVLLSPQPACVVAAVIKSATLDISNPYDSGCVVGQAQTFGIDGSSGTGDSLCADTVWNVDALATETGSSAQTVVSEGIAVRTPSDSVASFCP